MNNSSSSIIKKLSPEIVAKIAAGEVVENPASIVKELIENALDAKASHIDITLEQGGLKNIVVRDDGIGMNPEDLALSALPHTTSKIETEDDLLRIDSFGFRGEALSSIALVSVMVIKSRQAEAHHGHQIEIHYGNTSEIIPSAGAVGTEISIEGLFATLPARKKFLGDATAELRAVSSVVISAALGFPEIGFTLTNNKKRILDLPAEQSQTDRLHDLLGEDIASQLLPINHATRYGEISGFIGTPQSARAASVHQYLFVNGRPLSPRILNSHVTESYGSLIEPRTQGAFLLFLNLPFETVDINIHPRKEEVGFSYPKEIQSLVEAAVKDTLSKHKLTYTFSESENMAAEKRDMDRHTAKILKDIVTPWNFDKAGSDEILQINNLYLIAKTAHGLLMVDQHAAHERILYEQFKEALEKVAIDAKRYQLETPAVISLSAEDALLLEIELATFQNLGFDLEPFGKHTFKLSAVPALFQTKKYKELFTGILDDLRHGRKDHVERLSHRTLSYLACRAAIKAGDPLSQDERKQLIERLLNLTTPYTCPHGRPTHIELTLKDLDTLFKRR